ncbi:PHP domain-containing protein [bacterium]|nr:PHP domain-containing protein [bacterium]
MDYRGVFALARTNLSRNSVASKQAGASRTSLNAVQTALMQPNYKAAPSKAQLKLFRSQARERETEIKSHSKLLAMRLKNFLTPAPRGAKEYRIDLRIHTSASETFYAPQNVTAEEALVRIALVKSLDLIAITDCYSFSSVERIKLAAAGKKLTVIPGIDLRLAIQGCDDATFTAFFPENFSSQAQQSLLEALAVPASASGSRSYILTKSLEQVIEIVEAHQGRLIPSRFDQTPLRLQLVAMLVEKYGFRAFDLAHEESVEYFREFWPDGGFTFLFSSNAFNLAQVGSRDSTLKLLTPNFAGLARAIERK